MSWVSDSVEANCILAGLCMSDIVKHNKTKENHHLVLSYCSYSADKEHLPFQTYILRISWTTLEPTRDFSTPYLLKFPKKWKHDDSTNCLVCRSTRARKGQWSVWAADGACGMSAAPDPSEAPAGPLGGSTTKHLLMEHRCDTNYHNAGSRYNYRPLRNRTLKGSQLFWLFKLMAFGSSCFVANASVCLSGWKCSGVTTRRCFTGFCRNVSDNIVCVKCMWIGVCHSFYLSVYFTYL